jgi:putative acetyltransferase
MTLHPLIRAERPGDQAAIRDVIELAFLGKPYSNGAEAAIVESLRVQSGLSVSLVAEVNSRIVGQIIFSPAISEDGRTGWYALGPVAVLPGMQRQGLGASLIESGIAALAALHAAGCILVGDARYYSRFGFESTPQLSPSTEPAEYFMVKLLEGPVPKVPIHFHPAFYGAA